MPEHGARGGGTAFVALLVVCVAAGTLAAAALGAGTAGAVAGDPAVRAGCFGVDPGAGSAQIRVGMVVDGPDGLYRAVFGGPSGPVQGEGRVAGGRGLVIVPVQDEGEYSSLVLTVVDTGQSVRVGALTPLLPFTVGGEPVACDPATLVVEELPPTETVEAGAGTTTSTAPEVPTPDISTALPVIDDGESTAATETDTPPWALLAIPGGILVILGIVLLVRARSGSRSPRTT